MHCRPGMQLTLRERWRLAKNLSEKFILLTIEEAAGNGLFGPYLPALRVRPRLGDFVAISIGSETLVSPNEMKKYQIMQGSHGSLLPAEMNIPFVLCVPKSEMNHDFEKG